MHSVCPIRGASVVFALALTCAAGCHSVRSVADRPAASGAPAAETPRVARDGPAARATPLLPDPGPASAHPLAAAFGWAKVDPAGGWIRFLVELREQVDVNRLMADHDRLRLTRSERRADTLERLARVAEHGRAPLLPVLEELQKQGLVDYWQPLRFRDRIFVSARREVLETLRAVSAVAALIPEFDSVREAHRKAGHGLTMAPPVPPGDSWAVESLGLRALWEQGIDGRGVVVGILDSGVLGDHLALAPGRRGEKDWFDAASGSPRAIDTVPHGSQVLSCAVGRAVEGRALGAAPAATWVAALSNYFNSYNNVNMSLAADWMLYEGRPDVLLCSWGHGKRVCDPRDREMFQAFRAAGVVPILAAGNDGPEPGTGQAPAGLDGFYPEHGGPLAVAATDRNGHVIAASSRGPSPCGARPFPDVAAPGQDVPVAGSPMPNSLTLATGTSFSVGWVGGVAAFVLQVQPEMPVQDVEEIVRRTARRAPGTAPDGAGGYGIVDPAGAVEAARAWRPK